MKSAAMLLARMRPALLAFAFVAAASLPVRAEDEAMRTPAGYIVGVETPAADPDEAAHILREGQEVSVQIGGALFDGDQVVVREPRTSVVIETVNDRHLRVDAAHSPHPIKGELPAGGRFSAFAAMVGELFRARPEARTVNLIGRTDGTLRLQLGRTVTQRVVPGTRLWIAWDGGMKPYTVEIRGRAEGGTALATTRASGRSAVVALPRKASGPLLLAVSDAVGAQVRIDLLADPTPPAVPEWISEGAPTPAFGQVATALWLLDRKPAEWDLHAAAIAAEAGNYGAAEELLLRLAEGKRPAR
ncbi:hypothetical protein K9U40_00120 [Xanthobacter autotrophicus]|uniref:hypothetical protein n=1 Tax=Xanthobacter TaxID=279 RepID=UPI0024AA807F|nr:hypothetical protein [Xanthobacter autotrophicus]MDI4662748.1 hypothetical protein [Xanthobacter autotrophicus]